MSGLTKKDIHEILNSEKSIGIEESQVYEPAKIIEGLHLKRWLEEIKETISERFRRILRGGKA